MAASIAPATHIALVSPDAAAQDRRMEQDVIIIGAGVVGCSIALALSRRGLRSLNVDTLPAAGYGSTSHSSAIVRPFYSHVTSAAIAHEARGRWLNWASWLELDESSTPAHYTECGGLILLKEGEESVYDGNLAVLREVGVEYRILDTQGLLALYPGMSLETFGPPRPFDDPGFGEQQPGRISGGILIPAAGYVSDPQLAARNLMQAARTRGAVFRFSTRVARITREQGRANGVVLESGEELRTRFLINAAGPHSAQINELAGIIDTLPIRTRAHRHEVVYLAAPPGYVEGGNGFLVDTDCALYTRPDGRDLLIGTTDPACDKPQIVDPDDFSHEFTDQWTLEALRAAQRFPALGISNTARGTVALYDVSDDWIPIYDKTDLPGYYLAIGTSGNQFKNAPLIGDLLAEILQREIDEQDHDQEPAQLHLTGLDRTVDLSFYSRNRIVQATSSVMA